MAHSSFSHTQTCLADIQCNSEINTSGRTAERGVRRADAVSTPQNSIKICAPP